MADAVREGVGRFGEVFEGVGALRASGACDTVSRRRSRDDNPGSVGVRGEDRA